jgi:hypothetical protein
MECIVWRLFDEGFAATEAARDPPDGSSAVESLQLPEGTAFSDRSAREDDEVAAPVEENAAPWVAWTVA